MKRSVSGALLLIALALLVAGLAGPVKRMWEARTRAAQQQESAEKLAKERASLKADFDANRTQILARVREQIAAGEHAAAMKLAGQYVFINDGELRELFRKAATTTSVQQRIEGYRNLVQRECTEDQVRYQLAHLLDAEQVVGSLRPPIEYGELKMARLTGTEASGPVLKRLREPHPPEGQLPPRDAEWIVRVRAYNRAHPLPDFNAGLVSESAHQLLCVWRVEGTRTERGKPVRFDMVLWLPPAPDGKTLRADPVAYSEPPA